MSFVDEKPPPQVAVLNTTPRRAADGASIDRSQSRSRRWALLAALLCPCHLWLVAGAIGFFGAGAVAEAIRENQIVLAIVLAPLTAFALWRAVVAGRSASHASQSCASCPLPEAVRIDS